jgi:TRAP-type C4-dicarboxylate transport system permease small subunit
MSVSSTNGGLRLLPGLRRASDAVNRATIAACAGLLALMLVISAAGIFLELLLALFGQLGMAGLFDSGPLAFAYANTRPSLFRLFLPWLGMLSITVAFKYGEHIAIGAVARALPPWAARVAQAVNLAAIALFGMALVWYGIGFFRDATNLYIISSSLQVSHHWTAASVPVAGLILCLHLVDGMALLEERGEPGAETGQGAGERGVEGPMAPAAAGLAGEEYGDGPGSVEPEPAISADEPLGAENPADRRETPARKALELAR